MNSTSITDYILKLEKLNEESRTKIEQLKKLLNEANEEKVAALNKLNDTLYQKTARVTDKTINVLNDENADVVEYLLALSESADDRFKSIAYRRGAEVIADLPYEVLSGESLLHLKGIGKSIASRIDEFLEEQDSDYEESVASSDDDEYFISHNHDIYTMLMNVAGTERDPYKRQAYTNAASKIYHLPYELTSGQEAMKLPGRSPSLRDPARVSESPSPRRLTTFSRRTATPNLPSASSSSATSSPTNTKLRPTGSLRRSFVSLTLRSHPARMSRTSRASVPPSAQRLMSL